MIGIVDGDVILYRSCHKAIKDNLDVKITFDKLYQEIKDEIERVDQYKALLESALKKVI